MLDYLMYVVSLPKLSENYRSKEESALNLCFPLDSNSEYPTHNTCERYDQTKIEHMAIVLKLTVHY